MDHPTAERSAGVKLWSAKSDALTASRTGDLPIAANEPVARAPLVLAVMMFVVHCATNGGYGYFRDEFYYIACSDHLAAGYVDHPSLSIWLLAGVRALLGDSLHAIRLLPAIAGALLIVLTGRLTRELGGGRGAQLLAAIAVTIGPVFLVVSGFFSMNAFEPVFWTVAALIVVRLARGESPKLWLLLGVVIGLGLENKHSMSFFAVGLAVALVLTPLRRHLFERWLWLGAAIALVLFVPNVWWQIGHGLPTLEFMRNAQMFKNAPVSPVQFLGQQILMLHPLTVFMWAIGLGWLMFASAGRGYRALGWIYLVVLVLLLTQRGKAYYLAPAYPMLLAAGGIAIERWGRQRARWLCATYAVALLAFGVVLAPLGLPLLPVDSLARYARALGVQEGVRAERMALGQLPQHFADMFGWDDLVRTVAQVYGNLPPEDRARCAIVAQNYGEAGAIDFLGPRYSLPHAISGHNNYWLWGPGHATGELMIVIGGSPTALAPFCDSLEQAAVTRCDYCMPFENNLPIFLCRNRVGRLQELWERVKRYI